MQEKVQTRKKRRELKPGELRAAKALRKSIDLSLSGAYPGDEILIELPEVRRITSKGTTAVYEAIKNKKLPAPVKDGRKSLWMLREILECNRRLVHERDHPDQTDRIAEAA